MFVVVSASIRNPALEGWIVAVLAALLLLAPSARAAAPAHGRVWELATPGPTNGVRLVEERAWSADGDRIVYASFGPTPGAPSGELLAHGVAIRTADGWTLNPVGEPFTAPTPDLLTSGPLAVSPDLSAWLWYSSQPLVPGAPVDPDVGVYLRAPDGGLELLGDAGNRNSFALFAASDDLQHAVFQTRAHLVPADAGRLAGGDAYELAGSELRLVGADDAGAPISACGSEVGNGDADPSLQLHAASRDGARIFFSAPVSSDCTEPRRVYVREQGSKTTEISASACTRPNCDAPQDVTFAGALPDGSSAFLITRQQLTNDDVDDSADLYRYDEVDHALTRISAGPPGVAADLSGTVIRASDDGTRVYFAATGALVPGQGEQGRPNLYLSDHGQLRFLATLDDLDLRHAESSRDGAALVLATATPLVPTDTDNHVDVYRYDVASATFEQVSTGTDGRGNGAFDVSFGTNPFTPLPQQPLRYVSADGRRVFFVTSEALVPEDVNATADVYEWANGSVGLISSGAGDDTLGYGGASADGRSVFFTTDESLLPPDRDRGDADLYVARLGGGFPEPPPPPPPCEGDACQGPLAGRLAWPQPESLAYVEPPAPPPRPSLRVRKLDSRTRKLLAATGRATMLVEVPAAGRVSLVARARIHGHVSVVARDAVTAPGSATVRLRVRLSAAARRALRRLGSLRLTLVVRHERLGAAPAIALTLRSAA